MTINKKIKQGIYFGISQALFFGVFNLISKDIITTNEAIKTSVGALICGTIAGIIFVLLMNKYADKK